MKRDHVPIRVDDIMLLIRQDHLWFYALMDHCRDLQRRQREAMARGACHRR